MKPKRHRVRNRYGDDWLAFVIVIAGAVLALLVAVTRL